MHYVAHSEPPVQALTLGQTARGYEPDSNAAEKIANLYPWLKKQFA